MPSREKENNYIVRNATGGNTSGDGTVATDTDLAVVTLSQQAQVTSVTITGANLEKYELVVRNSDGTNETAEKSYATSDFKGGTFEDPELEKAGAGKEVALVNRTQLADASYGVNLKVHEIER